MDHQRSQAMETQHDSAFLVYVNCCIDNSLLSKIPNCFSFEDSIPPICLYDISPGNKSILCRS